MDPNIAQVAHSAYVAMQRILKKNCHKELLESCIQINNTMDGLVLKEAEKHGMCVREVDGTRTTISNLEGVIFDISLK